MKMLRKLISLLLVLSCLQFMFIPSYAASEQANTLLTVDVNYEEFINNVQYYRNLSKEGYLVYIDSDENEALALTQLLTSNSTSTDSLTPSNQTRSTYVPSKKWNVATQGSVEINGSSDNDTLYSSFKYYGSTSYEIFIHNGSALRNLNFTLEGAPLTVAIAPSKSLLYTLSTESENDAFYFVFSAPCIVNGYVADAS